MRSLSMLSSLAKADVLFSHRVDLTGQTGLFAAGSVLVVHMAGSGLIDRLACNCKEGFRFISVSSLNSIEDAAGSRADTGFLSSILGMALSVGFYTQDRCFDIRQVTHPPVFISTIVF